jgi:hypothetical protein
MAWIPPLGVIGEADLIRVYSGSGRETHSQCPALRAFKARPQLRVAPKPSYRAESLETFAVGPLMFALDLIEFEKMPEETAMETVAQPALYRETAQQRGRPDAHAGLLRWTARALPTFLRALRKSTDDGQGSAFLPVEHTWIRRSQVTDPADGIRTYEMTAWGRRYVSPDGRRRELWIPIAPGSTARRRADEQLVVEGVVLAEGLPARLPEPRAWRNPAIRVWTEEPDQVTPESVRVIEVDCETGETRVAGPWTAEQARSRYERKGRLNLRATVNGIKAEPGWSCSSCPMRLTCTTLVAAPGFLGVLAPGTSPTRAWSASGASAYDTCPSRHHLHGLGLSHRPDAGGPELHGRFIHAWLENQHKAHPDRKCMLSDLPSDLAELVEAAAIPYAATIEFEPIAALLRGHVRLCPLDRHSGPEFPRPEHTLALFDRRAEAVVIAKPDLLYQDRGAWIWRELKTSARHLAPDTDLLDRFPQLAVAVLMMRTDVLRGVPGASRVELELLTEHGPDLFTVDPFADTVFDRARAVITRLAVKWRGDLLFRPQPSDWACHGCSVGRWCPKTLAPKEPE